MPSRIPVLALCAFLAAACQHAGPERERRVGRVERLLADPLFGPHLDPGRIGAGEFSLGGYSVLALVGARTDLDRLERWCLEHQRDPSCTLPPEAPFSRADLIRHIETAPRFHASIERHGDSYRDPRVRSAAALAPAAGMALTEESLQRLSVPVLIIAGEGDDVAPARSNPLRVADLTPTATAEILPGVRHYSFLAECGALGRWVASALCAEEPGLSREAIHRRVADRVTGFFDETLAAIPRGAR